MRSGPILVLTLASVTLACTGPRSFTKTTQPPPLAPATSAVETPESTEPTAPSTVELAEGGAIVDGVANSVILVLARSGDGDSLVSYRADGSEVTTYSTDPGATIAQPIWSPDGARVAWTQTVDDARWDLVTAAVDGSDRTTDELPARPEYITYDPTTSRVLALTPSPAGFGLFIVELSGSDTGDSALIDLGVPYFSDFSPSGEQLIAHVAADVRIVDVSGGRRSLDVSSTGHQTPVWHPTDDLVYFTTDTPDGKVLVSYEPAADVTTELARFQDFIFFDIDSTGSRLAVSVIGPVGGLDAFRTPAPPTAADRLGAGLWIIDLADRSTIRLDARPTTPPMWDPTGSRVLVRNAFASAGRWGAYTLDGVRTETDVHDVGGSLLPSYLPYWDQYGRSQTLWSPDGELFVHVGTAESERSGVWVHDASASGASSFLVDGDLAFWSPT
jgi:Tol biopolymer transport system component